MQRIEELMFRLMRERAWSASYAHRYRFDNPREARRLLKRLGADRIEKVTVQLG